VRLPVRPSALRRAGPRHCSLRPLPSKRVCAGRNRADSYPPRLSTGDFRLSAASVKCLCGGGRRPTGVLFLVGPDSVGDATRLYGAPAQEPPAAPLPPLRDDKDTSPSLAVDVPQFAIAKEDVANGLQPFPDGIAWLQAHRYRTVLHLRAPGEDDSAARRQFEKRGLRYVSLEVSPKGLSKDVVDQFSRLVTENANLPLFVYDKEGALAGGLWYLYFRTAEGTSDEKARSEAIRLGFQPDQNNEHRTMWVAVQNYLRSAH
jgi:protein tyrosine phosphatase (PTP) superfamily phosphohydrolase (DUF442 family)